MYDMYGLKWNGLQDKLISQMWQVEARGSGTQNHPQLHKNLRLVWII